MRLCPETKSFNRYSNAKAECIDVYDVFGEIGTNNTILTTNKNTKTLGGPFTEELWCGNEGSPFKTVYSARKVANKDYQYVEFHSSRQQSSDDLYKIRAFLSNDDWKVLNAMVDTADNESQQCKDNSRACYQEPNSFKDKVNMMATIEAYNS